MLAILDISCRQLSKVSTRSDKVTNVYTVITLARRLRQLSVLAQSTNARPPLSIDCISLTSSAAYVHNPRSLVEEKENELLRCKLSEPFRGSLITSVTRSRRGSHRSGHTTKHLKPSPWCFKPGRQYALPRR